jgi:hypothetical protein
LAAADFRIDHAFLMISDVNFMFALPSVGLFSAWGDSLALMMGI